MHTRALHPSPSFRSHPFFACSCVPDTDDGTYNGNFDWEEISTHCESCGQQWCGSCQRALHKRIIDLTAASLCDCYDTIKLRDFGSGWQRVKHCSKRQVTVEDMRCPFCRAPPTKSNEEIFARRHHLVHGRAPGRFTAAALTSLAFNYLIGYGCEMDTAEAMRLYKLAADLGRCPAM